MYKTSLLILLCIFFSCSNDTTNNFHKNTSTAYDTITQIRADSIFFTMMVDSHLTIPEGEETSSWSTIYRYKGMMEAYQILVTDSSSRIYTITEVKGKDSSSNVVVDNRIFSYINAPNFPSYVYAYDQKSSDSFDKIYFVKYDGSEIIDLDIMAGILTTATLFNQYNYYDILKQQYEKIPITEINEFYFRESFIGKFIGLF